MDAARERQQSADVEAVQRAANRLLLEARRDIGSALAVAMRPLGGPRALGGAALPGGFPSARIVVAAPPAVSFMGAQGVSAAPWATSVRVHVLSRSEPDSQAAVGHMQGLEDARSRAEGARAQQAINEMAHLAHAAVGALAEHVEAKVAAVLGHSRAAPPPASTPAAWGAHPEVNLAAGGVPATGRSSAAQPASSGGPAEVRAATPGIAFPTLASLAEAMEKRRDVSESLEAVHVSRVQQDMLLALNSIARGALGNAVRRVQTQYAASADAANLSA